MLPMIKKECMLFELDAANKADAISQMVAAFDQQGYLNDKELFHKDVLEREKVFPTYIDYEIGLPHGKSDGVAQAGICIARLNEEIVWDEEAGETVNFIVMIAVNKENGNDLHLQVLSKLSRLLMHEDFREIIKTGAVDEVFDTLVEKLEVA